MHIRLLLLLLSGVIKGALVNDDPDLDIWGHHKAGSESLHLKHPTRPKPFLPFSKLGAPAGPGRSGPLPESGLSDPYTTIDKIRKGPSKQDLKSGPFKNHQVALGGLHPDEVFYADQDLLILRGGGYRGEPYDDSLRTKATQRFITTISTPKGGPSPPTAASQQLTTFSLFLPLSPASRGVRQRFNHVYLILPMRFLTNQGEMNPANQTDQAEPNTNTPEHGDTALVTPHKTSPLFQQFDSSSIRGELASLSDSPVTGRGPPGGDISSQPPSTEGPIGLPAGGDIPTTSLEVKTGHSLARDTHVNELFPRPPINPDAELFLGGSRSGLPLRGRIPK